MSIFRRWPTTKIASLFEFISFVQDQREIDREHYEKVEAAHKAEIEDNETANRYWIEETAKARDLSDKNAAKAEALSADVERLKAKLNAAQADEALDSFNEAENDCNCPACADGRFDEAEPEVDEPVDFGLDEALVTLFILGVI